VTIAVAGEAPKVVEAKRAGRIVECLGFGQIRSLAAAHFAPAVFAGILSALIIGQVIAGCTPELATITILVFAGIGAISALASGRTNWAATYRLDMLSRALDTTDEAVLIVASDGHMAYANAAFEGLFPDRGDAPLERIKRALSPDGESNGQFRQLRGRAAVGARASANLSLSRRSTGDPGHFKITVDPLADRVGYFLWRICDVTSQHQREAMIREERNQLLDLVDNAPIGIYSVDGTGQFRFINRTLGRWLGSNSSEIIANGMRLHDFLASPTSGQVPSSEPMAAHGRVTERGEIVLKTRQGRFMRAWLGQNVVGSSDALRTRSVICDLTPEREWQTALRGCERFKRCFANAPVGIALLDRSGRFEEANQAVADLFGVTPQSLKGQQLIGLLNQEDRERIAAKIDAAVDGRATPDPVEVRPRRSSDRTMFLFVSRLDAAMEGIAASDPQPRCGVTLHFIDITEQKNLEIQFAQSQKIQAVGQLAGGVAHDFNNLLTAMIGFCDLLLLRSPPGDPSFADIMQIKQNANRAANLVRQLLAFSRQQTLQPRVLNITDVLYELRHLLQRLIGENIKLDVVHGRDLSLAKVDQGQLEQVIINLAVNARDAMPNGGTLTIRTANLREEREVRRGHEVMPPGDYIMIEVTDTGLGIPKENLPRIFDPFFSTKEPGSGTGLGLSTVYGIVKQTGGFVFVSSTPGRGTAFQIFLPRFEAAIGAAPPRAGTADAAPAKDLTGHGTIMLVEDDDPVRIFGARALRNKGYKVIEATSGEAALDLIHHAAEKIDLLITDVVMPHMDGPTLVREVREIHPELKVIFISGYTEDAFRQRLDSDSGIDFLPKPFSLKQLAAKVRDVIAADGA
jgi:two-component system cell cycle sensor histidine kinase/response regulator CckA